MDVNRTSRVAIVGLFLAMMPLVCFAQERRPSYDPTGHAQSSKPKDGFVDLSIHPVLLRFNKFSYLILNTIPS